MSWLSGKSWGGIPRWWVVIVVVILVAAAIAIPVTLAGDRKADTSVDEGSLTTTSLMAGSTTTESTPLESTSTTDSAQASTSTTLPPAATTSSSSTTTSLWTPPLSIDPGVILQIATRYEDDHAYLEWVGSWATATSPAHSGGSAKYSNTHNSRVGIEFEGTGVRLISNTPVEAGRLTVHLYGSNGVDILETIDLAGAGASNVEVWYSGSLPNGQYQCWFGYDATHTPAGRLVWVDAIDVWGTVSSP